MDKEQKMTEKPDFKRALRDLIECGSVYDVIANLAFVVLADRNKPGSKQNFKRAERIFIARVLKQALYYPSGSPIEWWVKKVKYFSGEDD